MPRGPLIVENVCSIASFPQKTLIPSKLKNILIPKEGSSFVLLKYKDLDLRILASLSEENSMVNAFGQKNFDLTLASKLFEVPQEVLTVDQVETSKMLSKYLAYGFDKKTLVSLAKIKNTSKEQVNKYYENYIRYFKKIDIYFKNQIENAIVHGCVNDALGVKHEIEGINDAKLSVKNQAWHKSKKLLMNKQKDVLTVNIAHELIRLLKTLDYNAKLIMVSDDEFLFEIANSSINTLPTLLVEFMTRHTNVSAPLEIEVS